MDPLTCQQACLSPTALGALTAVTPVGSGLSLCWEACLHVPDWQTPRTQRSDPGPRSGLCPPRAGPAPLRDLCLLCLSVLRSTLTADVEVLSTALNHGLLESEPHTPDRAGPTVHRQCLWDTPERGITSHSVSEAHQHPHTKAMPASQADCFLLLSALYWSPGNALSGSLLCLGPSLMFSSWGASQQPPRVSLPQARAFEPVLPHETSGGIALP